MKFVKLFIIIRAIFLFTIFLTSCRGEKPIETVQSVESSRIMESSREPGIIKYFQIDSRYSYRIELLVLVLELTTDEYGSFRLEPLTEQTSQNRGLTLLENNLIDIVFLPTSFEREERFLPVKVPILNGILGYRVFLISKNKESDFANVKNFDELRDNFTAGFGTQWADMGILTGNKIKTYGSATYKNLFEMLNHNRFDFFPRGLNEAWAEIERNKDEFPDLMVEKNIGLYYPLPVYYFVNKNNSKLHERLEKGLKKAQVDGSFKKLFLKYHQQYIDLADFENRKLFYLENPFITREAAEFEKSWWLIE